jgi:hypothetical protein
MRFGWNLRAGFEIGVQLLSRVLRHWHVSLGLLYYELLLSAEG